MVTGAISGIGNAITLELCRSGYDVIAIGRRAASLADTKAGEGVHPLALDVTDCEALALSPEGKPIDVLVNNAGTMQPLVGFAQMSQSGIELYQNLI